MRDVGIGRSCRHALAMDGSYAEHCVETAPRSVFPVCLHNCVGKTKAAGGSFVSIRQHWPEEQGRHTDPNIMAGAHKQGTNRSTQRACRLEFADLDAAVQGLQ